MAEPVVRRERPPFDPSRIHCDSRPETGDETRHDMRIGRVGVLHCAYCHRTYDQIKKEWKATA